MKGRLLVIDDNVNLTTLLGKTLGRLGYDVFAENDSIFALDTTRRVNPDLILLDVMMPNRDGGEVLRDLRNDCQLRHIPVILLTGLAREAQGLAKQGGIESVVLSKPIELNALTMEIETHMTMGPRNRDGDSESVPKKWEGAAFGGPPREVMNRHFNMPDRKAPLAHQRNLQSRFRALLGQSDTDEVGLPR